MDMTRSEVRKLAGFDGSDIVADPMRDRRVNGVLGDVALDAKVIVIGNVAIELSALAFHLVRSLPCTADDFANSSHGLRVRRHHADRPQIVQDVFRGNGLRSDPRIGKCNVLGNRRR